MTDPNTVRRHLDLTRLALTPSTAARERVLNRLRVDVPPPSAAAAGGGGPRAAPSRWSLAGARGAALSVGLLALGFSAGYAARAPSAAAPPLPVSALAAAPATAPDELFPDTWESPPEAAPSRAARPASSGAALERLPLSLGTPPRRAPAKPPLRSLTVQPAPASDPSASTSPSGARDELALLQRADRAVRSGNAALALALIGELDERHPDSTLLEERRAVELLAHCEARATDAAARAARFLREHPGSVYVGRVRALCASPPASSAEPRR